MEADLTLKAKQAFWETPRNIALLLAAVAAFSGALGVKLGQQAPPQTVVIEMPGAK